MTRVISALTARTQLGEIIRRVSEKNERFVIRRRGEPKVVLMSLRDYIDSIAPAPEWLKEIQADANRKGLDKLTMREIDQVIAEVRRERRRKRPVRQPKR